MDPLKPLGRTLEEFKPLGPGEQQLLDACRKGEVAKLGEVTPEAVSDAVRVRAAFLRFLLLGGDGRAPVHEGGVHLRGAFVEGWLDLRGCRIPANVNLRHCRFERQINAMDAHVDGLFSLQGSHLADGLVADRLRCSSGVILRNGLKAAGEVRLGGARIGGDLDCSGAQFEVEAGDALAVDSVEIAGDVFLSDGFKATGGVRLPGARIQGVLSCKGGQFEVQVGDALSVENADIKSDVFLSDGFKATGAVRLLGSNIGGSLICTGGQFAVKEGHALSADRANVEGSVFLGGGFKASGVVRLLGTRIGCNLECVGGQFMAPVGAALSLDRAEVRGVWHVYDTSQPVRVDSSHAVVAVLVDDLTAWAPDSVLDGCRYAAFGGRAATSGMDRLKWLRKQSGEHLGETNAGIDFRPQPWRQLQRVLRDMGHTEDAKQVGIAFEDHLRAIGRLGQSPPGTPAPLAALKRVVAKAGHFTFGLLAGYGYRPIRLLGWMAGVWFVCGAMYWWLALPPRSAMAPSDPLVFQNPAYRECLPDKDPKPGNWYLCDALRGEYATFSPLAFSLDVMLPVVDLGQEKSWGTFVPTPREKPLEELFGHFHWGHLARLLIWFEILFGWLSSLLLVAIVSGFSRRNDEG